MNFKAGNPHFHKKLLTGSAENVSTFSKLFRHMLLLLTALAISHPFAKLSYDKGCCLVGGGNGSL
jgi:hypothetical protein